MQSLAAFENLLAIIFNPVVYIAALCFVIRLQRSKLFIRKNAISCSDSIIIGSLKSVHLGIAIFALFNCQESGSTFKLSN
jgi:hypothetical protein